MNEEILKKAIEYSYSSINAIKTSLKERQDLSIEGIALLKEDLEIDRIIIRSLKKQIAKEPIGKGVVKYCSNCHSIVNKEFSGDGVIRLMTYCKDCGQKVRCEDE